MQLKIENFKDFWKLKLILKHMNLIIVFKS